MAFHRKGRQITMLDSLSVSLGKAVTILLGKGRGVHWWLRVKERAAQGRWGYVLLDCGLLASFDASIKSTAPAWYSEQLQHSSQFLGICLLGSV